MLIGKLVEMYRLFPYCGGWRSGMLPLRYDGGGCRDWVNGHGGNGGGMRILRFLFYNEHDIIKNDKILSYLITYFLLCRRYT